MANEKGVHEEIVQMMVSAIRNRNAAADLFRRIASQIEWGGSHDESPRDIAFAVCQAVGRYNTDYCPPNYDPYEDFQESYVQARAADPVAKFHQEQVERASREGFYECDCDQCCEARRELER